MQTLCCSRIYTFQFCITGGLLHPISMVISSSYSECVHPYLTVTYYGSHTFTFHTFHMFNYRTNIPASHPLRQSHLLSEDRGKQQTHTQVYVGKERELYSLTLHCLPPDGLWSAHSNLLALPQLLCSQRRCR